MSPDRFAQNSLIPEKYVQKKPLHQILPEFKWRFYLWCLVTEGQAEERDISIGSSCAA